MARQRSDLVWKALADPTRRRILDLLREQPRTTGQIAARFRRISRFGVMKHIDVLESAGLVVVRARGRERWHHVNVVPLRQAYERWMRPWAEESAASMLNLKRHAEGKERQMPKLAEGTGTLAHFDIEQEIFVEAPRARVWDAVTVESGEWFPHRFREGTQVVFERRLGGHIYEDWGDGNGVLWDTITALEEGRWFRAQSPWGFAGGSAMIVVQYVLEDAPGGTLVKLTHSIYGDFPDEARAGFDRVARESGPLLKRYLAA